MKKIGTKKAGSVRTFAVLFTATLAILLVCAGLVFAHSVAQVQTTKYFAPETVQFLIDRASEGTPGFQVGDTINYIIQFTPVENNAAGGPGTVGVNGYITDYLPPGTEVIGASIVSKDGSGNFSDIPPSLPGGIDNSWSEREGLLGTQMFGSPFDTPAYDPTGRCAAVAPIVLNTYTGNGNYTVPAGVTSLIVEAWGGGGAAGAATFNPARGGGGAGGQYAKKVIAVTPGAVIPYTVGAGGTNVAGANGNPGGSSTFNGTAVIALGGAGGGACTVANCIATAGTGTATGGVGDIVYAGGSGSTGNIPANTGGAGGGGAGSNGPGGNAAGNTAGAGTATGGGNGGAGRTTVGIGNPGLVAGGGGGGGYTTAAGDQNGGNGFRGQIRISAFTCRGRLTEHYADTGIFFSTDPRTAQYPALPTRIAQGTNGYNILSSANNALNGAGQLNPIIGQTQATTHNLWDADQTNAFGSATRDITPLVWPESAQVSLVDANEYAAGAGYGILGTVPYYAGSAVAGPQTGYPLDNTGQIGPWQRIAYTGSRIGDPTTGPATNGNQCLTCVGGLGTSVGWNLSPSNPLPSGANAVRWAIGRLTVGELRYVKLSLRVTSPIPGGGLVNGSEVFGGDSSEADNGDDNVWRYHVPSVADNNSNLYVLKTVLGYYSGSTLIPVDGSMVPAGAKLRYRIVYLNTGNANQDNVRLQDTLPCQMNTSVPVAQVSNINVLSGPLSAITSPALNTILQGDCATNPDTRRSFFFNNNAAGVTLLPGAGGTIEFDVQTNAVNDDVIANTATLTSTQIPGGVTSNANSNVGNFANLTIAKTTSTPSLASGGTATYTITVTNMGTANATNINVYDLLPTMGGVANANTRFSYAGTDAIIGMTSVAPTTAIASINLTGTASITNGSPTVTGTGTTFTTQLAVRDVIYLNGTAYVVQAIGSNTSLTLTTNVAVAPSPMPGLTITKTPPPYNTGSNSTNQERVIWNFGTQTLAPGASFTITFRATVGASVAASATPYLNTVAAVYTGGTVPRIDNMDTAGVTVLSPLSVTKSVVSYCTSTCGTSSNWVAIGGSGQVPVNARVRYNIDYANTSAGLISNVTLTDTLPCQTAAAPVSYMGTANTVSIVSGPITSPTVGTLSAILAGACPGTRRSFPFPAASLNAGETGQITLDVQTNAVAGNVVANTATISGTSAPLISSEAQASVLSAPLLQITKSTTTPHAAVNGTATYQITVTNTGTSNAVNIALYDWLPTSAAAPNAATRFSYASTTSITGMTSVVPTTVIGPTKSPYSTDAYATNMQEIVWNFGAQTLAPGASFTVIFNATVGGSVPPSPAYYNNARVYYGAEQANSGAVAVSVGTDLSTSAKTWTDLNGGDAMPGDVIEYTITLNETSGIGATGISVSDTLSTALTTTSLTVVTCPTYSTTATCGFGGTQTLTATNISVPAGGSVAIVIRGTIAGSTATGTLINNCATVTNPGGTGATPCALTITVDASAVGGTGNKPLYLYGAVDAFKLSRTPTPGTPAAVTINNGAFQTWTENPALASQVRISNTLSTGVPVQLYLATATPAAYNITVGLYCSAVLVTSQAQSLALTATVTNYSFNLPLVGTTPCSTAWALRVTNGGANPITVSPKSGANISKASLPSMDVISVASVGLYDAAYPGGSVLPTVPVGTTVRIRAVVDDPFGSYDITGAAITIKDPSNTTLVSSATMTQVADSGALSKTYEYAYYVASGSPAGNWTIRVVATEGTEGAVTDFDNSAMTVLVPMPSIVIVKSVSTYSDPINGTTSPKIIPGSTMEYTILVTNTGPGMADAVVVNDAIPANTEFFAGDINGAGSGPIRFNDGGIVSGLTYTFTSLGDALDSPSFSNAGGAYVPSPDGNGFDNAVTAFRVAFSGSMNGASGGNNPSFSLLFRVRVK